MDIQTGIAMTQLGLDAFHAIKAWFNNWKTFKSSQVLYVNSNKKFISDSEFKTVISQYGDFEHVFAESEKPATFKNYRWHFTKQRIQLYRILKNMKSIRTICYSGMVSTPLSIFDGYILGDNHNYLFYDTNNLDSSIYEISYHKNLDLQRYPFTLPKETEDVCLVIESSSSVSKEAIKDYPTFSYSKPLYRELTEEDLQDVFDYVFCFMLACNKAGIKRVHLYPNCKQPVSFIVGTAIQSGAPETIVYEWFEGRYQWPLDLQKKKVLKEYK